MFYDELYMNEIGPELSSRKWCIDSRAKSLSTASIFLGNCTRHDGSCKYDGVSMFPVKYFQISCHMGRSLSSLECAASSSNCDMSGKEMLGYVA